MNSFLHLTTPTARTFFRLLSTLALALALGLAVGGCSKESKIARHLARGDDYYAAGDYDKARLEYLGVAQMDPKNVHAISQLGHIYFEDGIVLQAGAFYEQAIKLGSKDPRVLARLGTLLGGGKKFAAARDNARKALEIDPTSEDALFLLTDLALDKASLEDVKNLIARLRGKKGDLPVYDAAEAALDLKQRNLSGALALAQRAVQSAPKLAAAQFVLAGVYLSETNLAAGQVALAKAAELSPPRSTRQLQYFNFLAQRGSTNEARALLDKIIKAAPDYAPARLRKARIAFSEHDYKQMQSELSAILTRDPVNVDARVLEAQMHLTNHEPKKAETIMDQLIKQFPDSPLLQYQAAITSLANQNANQARVRLDKAYQLNSNAVETVLLRGRLYLARGEAGEVINSVQRLIATNAMIRPAYPLLGQAYVAKGETDRALAVFRDYEHHFTNDPAGPLNLGMVLLRNKEIDQAKSAFERAVAMRPDYLPAVEQLVRIDLATTNAPAAVVRAQKLVDRLPNSGEARVLLGQAQLAAKDAKSAEAEFEKAIELNPQLQSAYLLLAEVYNTSNRRDQALESLKKLLEKKPGDQKALMMQGILYTEMDKFAEAAASYESLLKTDSSFSPALNNLAYLYSEKLNNLDRAYELARKSRDLLPNDPRIADTLGWILYHRHEYTQALVYLEESAAALPQNAEVQYHLGMAHYAMAHEAPARAAFQLALSLDPKAGWRKDIEPRMEVLNANDAGTNPETIKRLEQFASENRNDVLLLTRLARAQESAQKWEDALTTYRSAAAASPDAVAPVIGQARVLAHQGDFANALDLVRKARGLAKSDSKALFEIGRIAYLAHDYPWSFALLQDSVSRQTNDQSSQFAFAQTAIAVGRLDVAKDALSKVTGNARADLQRELIPYCVTGSDKPLPAIVQKQLAAAQPDELLASYLKARSLAGGGDVTRAVQGLDAVLKSYPQFLPAKRSLALLLAGQTGGADRAEKLAREVREKQPNDAEMAGVLGQVAFNRSDFRYAGDMLQEATRTLTTEGELFLLLGQARAQTKQVADARQAINKALTLPLSDPQKRQAQQLLQKLK